MALIAVLVILLVFVVGAWMLGRYAPTDPPMRQVGFAVLGIVFVIFLLMLLGLVGPLGRVTVP